MLEKKYVINLLFDDGILPVTVSPPENLREEEFAVWAVGVDSGIAGYLGATQTDRNFKKQKEKHKHSFKFVEPSEDNEFLYFYCMKCDDICTVKRSDWLEPFIEILNPKL